MFGSFPDDLLSKFREDYSEQMDKSRMKCNVPQTTAPGEKSSHVVKACGPQFPKEGKIIRFGQKGVKGSPKRDNESESYRNRRESFKARHAKNIAKGPISSAWWANKYKWAEFLYDSSSSATYEHEQ
jgi:hypothetical protein